MEGGGEEGKERKRGQEGGREGGREGGNKGWGGGGELHVYVLEKVWFTLFFIPLCRSTEVC